MIYIATGERVYFICIRIEQTKVSKNWYIRPANSHCLAVSLTNLHHILSCHCFSPNISLEVEVTKKYCSMPHLMLHNCSYQP